MVLKKFLSMTSAIILFLIFAVASGVATIIESKTSTDTAWAYVYGTSWFGLIQLLLGINLAYNIYAYRLINLKKLPVFLFHLSFIGILIGSILTRYFGFEGNVHIRENSETNIITTRGSFINFATKFDGKEYEISIPRELEVLGKNGFDLALKLPEGEARLKYLEYVPNADYKFVNSEGGKPVIELVLSNATEREEVNLLDGEEVIAGNVSFLFNATPRPGTKYVLFSLNDNKFTLTSNTQISQFAMADNVKSTIEANATAQFDPLHLFTINGVNFSAKFLSTSAVRKLVPVKESQFDAIVAELSYKGEKKEMVLFHNLIEPAKAIIGAQVFSASWGFMQLKMPFSLYLKDFELLRYPGSNSPMSYASDVIVKDKNMPEFEYRIYMNHVLDHAGYRFFQSSYDQDERGTILSVNKDPGKIPTYISYFLLGLGLILNLINPNSRFRQLAKKINQDSIKSVILLVVASFVTFGVTNLHADDFLPKIDKTHADRLGRLLVQSPDGRIEPFDTISKEVLNKIHRKDTIGELNSNQAVLSIMLDPPFWRKENIIAVGQSKELKRELGIDERAKFANFNDFFTTNDKGGEYKLTRFTEIANRKHPGSRGTFDKEVIKVDERLNVFYMVFMGEIFKIFPKKDDPNNTWYSPGSALMSMQGDEANAIAVMMRDYFVAVDDAIVSGDWSKADKALGVIESYQREFGAAIIPPKSRIDTEILFNKLEIFDCLTPLYLIAGFVLLIFVFVKMLSPKSNINAVFKAIYYLNILAFLVHTAGLGLRWYIAQHAPWSNAYESMVYIAWALSLSGIVFSKQSPIAMALTSILAGVTLFVAHLSWLDPQITTLAPVLKSYWLTIHVSVITASYGFLGLCALLGFFVLVLMILQKKKSPSAEISRNVTEATRINEMAMILGLSLLTLGNFLGGVWANESWGRYWGWDSKETWALVSILVYAAVLHIRFIPKLNSQYAFAVSSMFAYWAIIMTYFGVNFYLSGMHSYAAGDPLPIPNYIYVIFAVMFGVSIFAYFKRQFFAKL
ncbi:cytochrome c biogenesis protein CcsA [Campylobacter gastrosuis]|uniref:Cytochrome c biogenesis protein CcsA n=1 Tax=Campylobacter gastrosuis TaxID=2974576 RepID=A0ABT7HMC7_9BACT|nr:cytochrome c biogenesis protein CcsA [Campylobacter gastrosuis]MDL0087863.1 cytochrome c biogenesis protein CcsA [Campylobacter gastrosuis]MDL0088074.1 cytochrome c biogenesis protein CcsA [Campylobacter gastrosuis]